MGGLLHSVQREGDWAGCSPAQSPPRCTKCNSASVPVTVLLYDGPLLCGFNVATKGLMPDIKFVVCLSVCWGRITSETAEGIWLNVPQGRHHGPTVPATASRILVLFVPGIPPEKPKCTMLGRLCKSYTDCQVLGSQVSVILATYVTAFLRH